jgi:hypothetical protein
MWKLDYRHDARPKVIVVCRVRRSRNDIISFGLSKPCCACIDAMPLYNVVRACYSVNTDEFVWENTSELTNEYSTQSKIVVKM